MPHFPHLLAAGEWIQLLFIVIFFIIPVLSKLLGGGGDDVPKPKRAERRPVRPQPPKPAAGGGQQAAAGGQGQGGNALEAEIEAFLRRARGEQPKPKPQPQPQPAPVEQVRRLVEKPRSIKQQESPQQTRESITEHVQRHISSRPVGEHARDLGKSVGQADEMLESHLHDVFDHKIGSLAKEQLDRDIPQGTDAAIWETAESKRQKRADAAGDRSELILGMLGNRESIKQAIILGEVLKRPDFD